MAIDVMDDKENLPSNENNIWIISETCLSLVLCCKGYYEPLTLHCLIKFICETVPILLAKKIENLEESYPTFGKPLKYFILNSIIFLLNVLKNFDKVPTECCLVIYVQTISTLMAIVTFRPEFLRGAYTLVQEMFTSNKIHPTRIAPIATITMLAKLHEVEKVIHSIEFQCKEDVKACQAFLKTIQQKIESAVNTRNEIAEEIAPHQFLVPEPRLPLERKAPVVDPRAPPEASCQATKPTVPVLKELVALQKGAQNKQRQPPRPHRPIISSQRLNEDFTSRRKTRPTLLIHHTKRKQ